MTVRPPRSSDHRQRILQAMADVLMDKRYSEATVADVAALAHVSKRSFYEHFDNKEMCLLALCEHTSEHILAVILQAYDPSKSWDQLVQDVTRAYLQAIQASPALMHSLYVELFAAGRPGLEMRRAVGERFADFLCSQVEMLRSQGHALKSLGRLTAVAVVAGVNELILQAFMDGQPHTVMDLADTCQALVHAVTRAD